MKSQAGAKPLILAKTLQLTHNDLDGIGCAVIGKMLGAKYTLICSYSNIDEKLRELTNAVEYGITTDVYITDLSFEKEHFLTVDKLITKHNGLKVTYLDHHESSYNNLLELFNNNEIRNVKSFKVIQGVSATELMFDERYNISSALKVPYNILCREFVQTVTAWDLQLDDSVSYGVYFDMGFDLNLVARQLPIFTAINTIYKLLCDDIPIQGWFETMAIDAKVILDSEKYKLKSTIDNANKYINSGAHTTVSKMLPFYSVITDAVEKYYVTNNLTYGGDCDFEEDCGNVVIIPSTDYKITSVARDLFNKFQGIDVVIEVSLLGDRCTIGLRSRKGSPINVATIAGILDPKGGGHPNAAGCCIQY